jgi:hypothetical protein
MLALDTSSANAAVVGADVTRLSAETFVVVAATLRVDDERAVVELQPRDHPRDALRALMRRFGPGWLVEDDGWYANVTWVGERFPIAGVEAAQIFLRPCATLVRASGFRASRPTKGASSRRVERRGGDASVV